MLFDRLADRVRPTAVVLYLGINDTISNTFPWLGETPDVGLFDWRDPRHSLFLRLVEYYGVDKELRARPDFASGELRSPAILRAGVERVIASARRVGSLPVLATFALGAPTDDAQLAARIAGLEPRMEHFWGRLDSTQLAVAAHNAVLEEVAGREGLSLARVDGAIPHDSEHFGDLCHLTPRGNAILGRVVADAVWAAVGRGSETGQSDHPGVGRPGTSGAFGS